ncbi:MarR family winged helix-turn-helix transcriptional regulator [Alicyclobacillus tolerans]|nr:MULTISPECIES: MarR family transcriptional regulator [Alicyclobacillus]MDP9728236.1 DNA-binding MarR family transcriptional regulator [Alicyclobacillus tengchongensis]
MHSAISEEQVRTFEEVLTKLSRVLQAHSPIKRFGLTPTQAYLLRHLYQEGKTKASDLARVADLSPGAVTQVCDELVKMQMVERKRSQEDRRVVFHEITNKGFEILSGLQQERCNIARQLLTELGSEDAEQFIRLMGRVVEFMEMQPIERKTRQTTDISS